MSSLPAPAEDDAELLGVLDDELLEDEQLSVL
jgi:hypothetical protein